MGYGIKCTSNYAQRFAFAFMHIVARLLRPFDRKEFDEETCPEVRAWIDTRKKMSRDKKAFEQCKLHNVEVGPIFTDDSYMQIVGEKRSVRVLLA